MIIDTLENCRYYTGIGERFVAAFDFLAENAATLAVGRHVIIPGEVYVNVREYDIAEGEEIRLEAHRRYADIQCVLEGVEIIGYRQVEGAEPATEYDEQADLIFYRDGWEPICMPTGKFAVLFPGDGHAVKISPPGGAHVKKAIVKVLLD